MGPFKAFRRFLRNRSDFYRDNPSFSGSLLKDDIIYFSEWFRILNSEEAPIELGLPWITVPATRFLKETVQPGMRIFEWGCGGSTLFYASKGCEVTSIEHSLPWCKLVAERLSGLQNTQCSVEYIPPDEIVPGAEKITYANSPVSYRSTNAEFEGRTFLEYSTKIESFPNGFFDLIAIDGRARSSCLFHALKKIKPGGYLLLDNSEREEYSEGMEVVPESWSRVHFVGPIVSGQSFGCTTVWKATQ